MPHDLATFRNGDVSFYSAREPAWHRLGTVTRDALNAKDALKAAHLDGWDIQKRPLSTLDANGRPLTVPGKFATVRRNPDPDGPPFDTLGTTLPEIQALRNARFRGEQATQCAAIRGDRYAPSELSAGHAPAQTAFTRPNRRSRR